jgi:lysozyme family protein
MGDFIDDIILREGGDKETNDPSDSGGRTKYGISERAHPELWKDGPPTYAQARACYISTYVLPFQGIDDLNLVHQLVDWAVTSGTMRVAQALQQVVGVMPDGVIGPKTLAAINNYNPGTLFGVKVPGFVLLNLAIRDARTMLYAATAKARPKDQKYVLGWIARAQQFK